MRTWWYAVKIFIPYFVAVARTKRPLMANESRKYWWTHFMPLYMRTWWHTVTWRLIDFPGTVSSVLGFQRSEKDNNHWETQLPRDSIPHVFQSGGSLVPVSTAATNILDPRAISHVKKFARSGTKQMSSLLRWRQNNFRINETANTIKFNTSLVSCCLLFYYPS